MKNTVAEQMLPGLFLTFEVEEVLAEETTPFQKIGFYKTPSHGTLFLLDDTVMLTDRDEYVYHEMISHVPLFSHPSPRRVLVVGGGDLGVARECLKHPSVEEIVVCEIDGRVVDLSKEHLSWVKSTADNPRVRVMVGDGFEFIQRPENRQRYDVILVDVTDATGLHAQPQSEQLFSTTFFGFIKQALAPGGVVAGQCESAFYNVPFIARTAGELKHDFKLVNFFTATNQTYPGGLWCFYFASDALAPLETSRFDAARSARAAMAFKYYTAAIHRSCFTLPAALENELKKAAAK